MLKNLLADTKARNLIAVTDTSSDTTRGDEDISSRLKSIGKQAVKNLLSPAAEPLGGALERLPGAALNPVGNVASFVSSAAGVPEEQAAPAVLGAVGGFAGSRVGRPNLGLGLGVALGDLVKQSAQKLRGSGEDIDIGDAVILGGVSALGGKVLEATFRTVGLSTQLIPERARAAFFEKTLQAVNIGRKAVSRQWRRSVAQLVKNNPDKRVNLSVQLKAVKNQLGGVDKDLIPQLKSAVRKNARLRKAIDNPDGAINLTLQESQELKNAITSTTNAITKKAVKGKTTPNERVVFDILNGIDDQITKSFPEMTNIRAAYAQALKDFNLARPLVEPGVAVEKSIFSQPRGLFGAGGTPFLRSTQGKLAFKDIVSKTGAGAKIFRAAELAHKLNRIADFIGRAAQISIGGAVAGKLFGRSGGNFER